MAIHRFKDTQWQFTCTSFRIHSDYLPVLEYLMTMVNNGNLPVLGNPMAIDQL